MTNRIRSSRRLMIIGAALLAAAGVALLLAAVFRVHAVALVLLALTLVFVAARAVDHPRASIAILHAIGALVFVLGIVLVGIATAIALGPSSHAAIFIMFLSGAAEFAAAGLAVAAASRLPGPATSEESSAWKMRVAPAAMLGIGLVFLGFLLGEGIDIPASVPAAEYVGGLLFFGGLGGYSLLATYVVSRGLPRTRRNLWIVFAMNAVLLLVALIALLVEQNKSAVLVTLGFTLISIACSYGGLALAARSTRRHKTA